jgi:hypothetical protein
VFVCPAEDASPETILPALAAPYLCVPYNMTVRARALRAALRAGAEALRRRAPQLRSLDAVLSPELGVPPGDGWGNGGMAFSEGGAAVPMWSQVGFLRQRCDARGDAFCLQYRLNTGNTASPPKAAAAVPQPAPLGAAA